jgi:hypothetical protein
MRFPWDANRRLGSQNRAFYRNVNHKSPQIWTCVYDGYDDDSNNNSNNNYYIIICKLTLQLQFTFNW